MTNDDSHKYTMVMTFQLMEVWSEKRDALMTEKLIDDDAHVTNVVNCNEKCIIMQSLQTKLKLLN